MKYMNKEFSKFILVGVTNTVVTYIIYLVFLQFFEYNIAYGISYLSGIAISFILNGTYVFKTQLTIVKALKYPIVYIVQYLINFTVLNVLIKYIYINEMIAPLLVIIISIPITFTLSKTILKN